MNKDSDLDTMQEQYRLPLNMAPDGSVVQTNGPARFVVHMTPEAGAAIKAQAAKLVLSAEKHGVTYKLCKAVFGGPDLFPIGDHVGSTVRGSMSVIDSMFDPLSVVRKPIHKCVDFVLNEGTEGFSLVTGAKRRVDMSRFDHRRQRRGDERLVG